MEASGSANRKTAYTGSIMGIGYAISAAIEHGYPIRIFHRGFIRDASSKPSAEINHCSFLD